MGVVFSQSVHANVTDYDRLLLSDPSIVNFLRQKRKATLDSVPEKQAMPEATAGASATAEPSPSLPDDNALPELDIFQHDDIKKWLHFDVVETAKLEWMRDLPANVPELKPGESYEARYEWRFAAEFAGT